MASLDFLQHSLASWEIEIVMADSAWLASSSKQQRNKLEVQIAASNSFMMIISY
jgi:hypothetical protein